MAQKAETGEMRMTKRWLTDEAYCSADCGCAGGQPAASCNFVPGCKRCRNEPRFTRNDLVKFYEWLTGNEDHFLIPEEVVAEFVATLGDK